MDERTTQQQAIELLQQLGLKEYEAKSFVALSRIPHGSAKDISEISAVPRTRVYDAIRVLETKGLVEIQHTSPQQFHAVSIEEATDTLRREYESRTDKLRETLSGIEPATPTEDSRVTHEVWSLSGTPAIASRTQQLITEAATELILVVGRRDSVTDELVVRLSDAADRGVSVVIGTTSTPVYEQLREQVPNAAVFRSTLEWLHGENEDTEITRLLLVDKKTILISSSHIDAATGESREQAVFGRGFNNGLVVIIRRLMATGLRTGS